MNKANLMLHTGAKTVAREQVNDVATPAQAAAGIGTGYAGD